MKKGNMECDFLVLLCCVLFTIKITVTLETTLKNEIHTLMSYIYFLRNKFDLVKDKFKAVFKEEPFFYSRAPGRVNLIGKFLFPEI